jgi:anti-sigma B factor antagonist
MEDGQDFEVTRRGTLDGVIVAPAGEIDLATVDEVRAAIDAARAQTSLVILDLRQVTFIDSAGVRLVVEGAQELAAQGGELVVVRGGPDVRRVFDLVGLDGRVRMLDAPPGE